MPAVYFLYRSRRPAAHLTVRIQSYDQHKKKYQFEAKIKYTVEKEFWEVTRHKKRYMDADVKKKISDLNDELAKIENYALKQFELESPLPENKEWLKIKLKDYYNPPEKTPVRNDSIIHNIQHLIDTASTRENSRGGLGISKSRINAYKTLMKIFKEYQGRKRYKVRDVDIKFGKNFLKWLIQKKNYSESYAKKRIDDLRTVCSDAGLDGLEVSPQLIKVRGGKSKNNFIIYLSPQELNTIKKLRLESSALENSRKWLLLGCNIGQRGGDLLKLSENNFVERNGLELIELKQQKTDKHISIPVLPTTKEILQDGLPHKISMQKFNEHIKLLCRLAGMDNPTQGKKIAMLDKKGQVVPPEKWKNSKGQLVKRKITGTFPKHELITSHICRRSFATNLYGILPTPLIMQITGHGSEKMLLQYIGKHSLDYAQQIADFYSRQYENNKNSL